MERELSRYLLRSAVVVLATAALIVGLMVWQDRGLAAATADRHLDTIALAQALAESQEARDLGRRAELIAGNQAVVGYVSQALGGALPGTEVDRTSIIDLLEERRDQLGLTVAAVLDNEGNIVAATERFSVARGLGGEALFQEARKANAVRSGVRIDGTRLLHVAILPLTAYGFGESYLLVGTTLGAPFARAIAEIGDTDVALVATTADGTVVIASTLDAATQTALLPLLSGDGGSAPTRTQVQLLDEQRELSRAPLFGSQQAQLVALVSPERDAAAFDAVRRPILAGGVLGLLALMIALWQNWVRVRAPVRDLTDLMTRAADSRDFHLKAPVAGGPAMRRLTAALNRMFTRI